MEWEYLPLLVLEDIFSYLSLGDRFNASLVCQMWNECFYSQRVWKTMRIQERSFTRRKFTMYKGYTRELESKRIQRCLSRVGQYFSKIIFSPISDFLNLFGILRVFASFLEYFEEYPMPLLQTFHFEFSCESRGQAGTFVYGTGGQIYAEIKKLLANLRELKYLKLNELLLNNQDANNLLGDLARNCGHTIKTLEILNSSGEPCPLFQLGLFRSLRKLVISPHNINDDLVVMLAKNKLQYLVITQDTYTPKAVVSVSQDAWYAASKLCPEMKVELQVIGHSREEIMHQYGAPVCAVLYKTPYALISSSNVLETAELYSDTLEVFGHKCLPRIHNGRSFNDRADSALLLLVRSCSKLKTLIVRDRISTATVLLIATECNNLRHFYVRLNAIIKRMDWPNIPEWSSDFYTWLKVNSKSYDLMEKEVSRILERSWRPLTDKEFVKICGIR